MGMPASAGAKNATILKEVTWCDNTVAGLIRSIRLSARGLKSGALLPVPSPKTEQERAGASCSEKAKTKKTQA
jgi:hypothetical protein